MTYRIGSDLVIPKKNTHMNNALNTFIHRRSLSIGSADITRQSWERCWWPSFILPQPWSNHYTHDPDDCSCACHHNEGIYSLGRRMNEEREGESMFPLPFYTLLRTSHRVNKKKVVTRTHAIARIFFLMCLTTNEGGKMEIWKHIQVLVTHLSIIFDEYTQFVGYR